MHQDVELPGSIAENPQLGRHPMINQTAQQGPLTGDSYVRFGGDAYLLQVNLPQPLRPRSGVDLGKAFR